MANLDMLKPRFLLTFVVTSAAILFATLPFAGGDEPFRDPLTGKTASRRDGRPSKPVLLKVSLTEDKSNGEFALSIHLPLPPGGYTYSTNPDFTGATKIKLTQTEGLEPIGDTFTADHEPHTEFQADFGQAVEKFKEDVTWTRRFRLKAGVKKADAQIFGQVRYQICDASNCTPYNETFLATGDAAAQVVLTEDAAALKSQIRAVAAAPVSSEVASKTADSDDDPAAAPKPFEIKLVPQRGKVADPIKVRFRLSPEDAKPGQAALLSVTMELDEGWHTFALDQDPKNAGLPTLIEVTGLNGLKAAEEKFSPTLAPEFAKTDDGKQQRLHHKEITWTMPLSVEKAEYGLSGSLMYQICREGQCRPPKTVRFELGHIAKDITSTPTQNAVTSVSPPVAIPSGASNGGEDATPTLNGQKFEPREEEQAGGLGLFLVYAFLGGLILNVMPCVLPVIAIKVLSFVQQAGQSRSRILLLNLTYSLGVLVVFLLLASLAVFAKLGWGNLFQQTEFQVAMSCVVFAMGLSLMGVFEIPVPGMVGSAASHQHQEGPLGAFLTGIFATLLATPCSGPFLGVTLGWSVQQPAHITYLVWAVMGLGMASPYILLGFFPGWVKYLPKPGNWMVTFKEVCGFVLMGTVIFLMSSLKANWVLPLLILLLAIGVSLWMIGKLYSVNSTGQRRWTVRAFAALISVAGVWIATDLADVRPGIHELPWQPFAGKAVKEELKRGRTVLVDFTADWCLSCKTNEKLALNTPETLERIKQHKVVTLKADWTDGSPEITQWLEAFDSVSVPLTVIFPAGDPLHPIVIRDLYAKSELLRKLDEAVEVKADLGRKLTQR